LGLLAPLDPLGNGRKFGFADFPRAAPYSVTWIIILDFYYFYIYWLFA